MDTTQRPTRDECLAAAGAVVAASDEACAQMTPREQAEAAWTPTSRRTVDELEDLIRSDRGLAPVHHDPAEMADLLRRHELRVTELTGGARAKSVDGDGK